jgi:hypothetical protein
MRMGCAAAALVIATAACGKSAASPTGPSTRAVRPAVAACGPRAARTLAANRRARIYAAGGGVFGCATGTGHAYLLGQGAPGRPGQDRVGRYALAGVDAGYAVGRMGVDTLSVQVVVRRLDTGQVLHEASATTQPPGPEFFQSVEALLVKADGAVAWIADSGSIVRHTHDREVVRLDRRGEARLDSGLGIYPPSLRLSGSRLTWRNRGALRSATLL